MGDTINNVSDGTLHDTPPPATEAEATGPHEDYRAWYRRAARQMALETGEPVLVIWEPPCAPAGQNSACRGTLSYLVLASQADKLELNSDHERYDPPALAVG